MGRTIEDRFRLHLIASGKTDATTDSYVANVRVFRAWCREHELDPDVPDREAVMEYVAHERARLGPNTVALRLSCIRSFFEFLGAPPGFLEGIRAKRAKLAPRRPYSEDEFNTILAGCRNKRDKDMITIAYRTGMRVAEIVSLRSWDVDLSAGLVLVHGKGQKERWVIMDEIVQMLISPYLQHSSGILWWTKDGKPLTVKRAKRNMWEIAQRIPVHAHWHRIRNTFASDFLKEMHDIDALQTIMGHEDSSTTRRYAAYDEQSRALLQMRRFSEKRNLRLLGSGEASA